MLGFGIEDVIAAFIGAVFGATANGWVSGWRDRRQKRREVWGLLRLISSEMSYNSALVAGFEDAPEAYTEAVSHLRTDTWDRVYDRLAQLLPSGSGEDLSLLIDYYGIIRLMQIKPDQASGEFLDIPSYPERVGAMARKYGQA